MPLDPAILQLYLAACFVLVAMPGPDMMLCIANGLAAGTRGAALTVLGLSIGVAGHIAGAAFGIAALLAARPVLFDAVRLAGALYLGWLGLQALRAALASGTGPQDKIEAATLVSDGMLIRRAALTNLLNPKVSLFFLAFLPQFVDPGRGQVWLQMVLLGLVPPALGMPVNFAIGAMAGRAARRLARGAGSGQRWLQGAAGAIFLALAARLALVTRA